MQIKNSVDYNVTQGVASYVDYINKLRLINLKNQLEDILSDQTSQLYNLHNKSTEALRNIDLANNQIDRIINTNRGGSTGLHGFISESAETGIRNARDIFNGLKKSTELLDDNGMADLLVNGKEIQMKFYNNIINEINSSAKYNNMQMMFPKDHVDLINQIMDGSKNVTFNGNALSNAQINNIRKAIEEESTRRDQNFKEWISSSVNNYKDVQPNTINQTLENERNSIKNQTLQEQSDINNTAKKNSLTAKKQAQPNIGEATNVAAISAAVQGGLNLGIFIFQKNKDGKKLWEFDSKDWSECGIETSKGAIKGGVSGYSIYGLTNIMGLSAPSAGAIVSGTFGLSNAVIQYRTGKIDDDSFIDLITLNAIDATGAALGASVGQLIIPIPILGAVIGSIVTITALSLGKDILNKKEIELIDKQQEKMNTFINKLDKKYQKKLVEIMNMYYTLGELQEYSFNLDINIDLRLNSSIEMAKLVGVSESQILKNEKDIDNYFLN